MQLYQVRSFVAVSRFLNFTRAAEHCNVTQPAMTKAARKLEYELGRLSCDALGHGYTRNSDCGGVYAGASASRPRSQHQCYCRLIGWES
jgi:hypothetical protein